MTVVQPAHKNDAMANIDPDLLVQAFETFTRTSEALEKSYEELQRKVSELNLELEQKNSTLADNLAETERISTHLSAILSSMRDGVLAYDLDGNVTMANEAAGALLETDPKKAIGRDVNQVLVAALGYLPKLFDDDQRNGPCECHVKRGEEIIVFQIERHWLKDSRKKRIGGILTLEDVTQTTFARQQQQRDERLAGMGKMAVNIVHEIRNPMGSIELMASLLRRDLAQDPPKRELAERISNGIRNLNHIIENLLMFSRDREPAFSSLQIAGLIDDAVSMVEPMFKSADILISRNFGNDVGMIRADRELLKQAILNVLINAAQAMPEGGELRLATNRRDLSDFSTGRPAVFCQLRIADTGQGIAPEAKARIFDPFFTTKEKGTGLGLALVHKIVQAHGGFIGVDSTPGQGSIFTLMLPVQPKEKADD